MLDRCEEGLTGVSCDVYARSAQSFGSTRFRGTHLTIPTSYAAIEVLQGGRQSSFAPLVLVAQGCEYFILSQDLNDVFKRFLVIQADSHRTADRSNSRHVFVLLSLCHMKHWLSC